MGQSDKLMAELAAYEKGLIPDELCRRQLPDGRWLIVNPLVFGRARMGITNRHCRYAYDDQW
jgi:hypothetical protein